MPAPGQDLIVDVPEPDVTDDDLATCAEAAGWTFPAPLSCA